MKKVNSISKQDIISEIVKKISHIKNNIGDIRSDTLYAHSINYMAYKFGLFSTTQYHDFRDSINNADIINLTKVEQEVE